MRMQAMSVALWCAALCAAAPALARNAAGEVQAIAGLVTATALDGSQRTLSRGDEIYPQERLITAEKASVDVEFSDGGRLQLGPRSNVELASYAWQDQAASFLARFTKGTFRLVTGLIARREIDRYRADVLVATIGVRGTDFAGEVEGESARIVLLEPENGAPTSIEVWNEFGRVTIDEPGFGTEIPDARSPPSPPRRMRLEGVNNISRTLQQVQRLHVPRPPRR